MPFAPPEFRLRRAMVRAFLTTIAALEQQLILGIRRASRRGGRGWFRIVVMLLKYESGFEMPDREFATGVHDRDDREQEFPDDLHFRRTSWLESGTDGPPARFPAESRSRDDHSCRGHHRRLAAKAQLALAAGLQ